MDFGIMVSHGAALVNVHWTYFAQVPHHQILHNIPDAG